MVQPPLVDRGCLRQAMCHRDADPRNFGDLIWREGPILADGNTTISIFIIGPMGSSQSEDDSVPRHPQIVRIRNAIRLIIEEFRDAPETDTSGLFVDIQDPERRMGGDVTDNVFSQIDTADLGIADISDRSPSVIYEYGLMHALGIPVIVLDKEGQTPPFYWRNQQLVRVPTFDVDVLIDNLREPLRNFIFRRGDADHEQNPITRFYGTALVDMAASTGLATGQFYNFIRYLLMDGSVLTYTDLEELVIVRPSSIQQASDTNAKVRHALPDIRQDEFRTSLHPRGKIFFERVGRFIYDYPTPLEALTISPRYRRVLELIQRGEDPEDSPLIRKIEDRMIDTYFRTLRQLSIREAGTNPRKLKFMTAEEFIDAATSS